MKFSHISDTHLGFSQFGTGKRAADIYKAFEQAIDISIEQNVDFVIFAGDIFHTPTPDGTAIMNMAHALKRLQNVQIPVFFILGEHDISHAMLHPVPFVYHKLDYATYVGKVPAYYNGVMIAGIDKMRKGEVDERRDYLEKLDKLAMQHDGLCILLAHQGIAEAHKFATEIVASDLPKNFNYYAMGHIHEKSEWNFNFLGGPLTYPGSIEVIGSEGVKNTKKGFYIVDIISDKAVPKWTQLDTRPQIVIHTNAESLKTEIDKLVIKDTRNERKPIVDLRISGTINPEIIRAHLARLEGKTFHTSWREQKKDSSHDVFLSRPTDTESEMFRLALESLDSENLAQIAIRELLEPLSQKDMKESERIILKEYDNYKKDHQS
ncbi:MAG: metallophosphoesterase [Cenarchaeum symbiont of Oopsacas minuta]|nr:metallophosphoesterase [Cenarchaeum symbiont of Oopsacas minuta]